MTTKQELIDQLKEVENEFKKPISERIATNKENVATNINENISEKSGVLAVRAWLNKNKD